MSYAYPYTPKKSYRTAEGFKEWCFGRDLKWATSIDREGAPLELFVECPRAMLVVKFNRVDGGVYDAMVHVENGPTHMLGSNTLGDLNQAFLGYVR